MAERLVDRIMLKLENAAGLYYRLIIVVAPVGGGRTAILHDVTRCINAPLINVNLELSRRMLDLTEKQRILRLPQILEVISAESASEVVILDNIEILFNVSMRHDPLLLLQRISRNRTVVASWNGSIENGYLIYAAPGHPEYRRYLVQDFLVVDIQASD